MSKDDDCDIHTGYNWLYCPECKKDDGRAMRKKIKNDKDNELVYSKKDIKKFIARVANELEPAVSYVPGEEDDPDLFPDHQKLLKKFLRKTFKSMKK